MLTKLDSQAHKTTKKVVVELCLFNVYNFPGITCLMLTSHLIRFLQIEKHNNTNN